MEFSDGLINLIMKGSFWIIRFMEWELMCGEMVECMQVNGDKIRCMEWVNLNGQMEEDIKVNI